jgi:hypothetical protein
MIDDEHIHKPLILDRGIDSGYFPSAQLRAPCSHEREAPLSDAMCLPSVRNNSVFMPGPSGNPTVVNPMIMNRNITSISSLSGSITQQNDPPQESLELNTQYREKHQAKLFPKHQPGDC